MPCTQRPFLADTRPRSVRAANVSRIQGTGATFCKKTKNKKLVAAIYFHCPKGTCPTWTHELTLPPQTSSEQLLGRRVSHRNPAAPSRALPITDLLPSPRRIRVIRPINILARQSTKGTRVGRSRVTPGRGRETWTMPCPLHRSVQARPAERSCLHLMKTWEDRAGARGSQLSSGAMGLEFTAGLPGTKLQVPGGTQS